MYEKELKDIRARLRLAMNGVASTSMRAHGVDYKVNFGVSLSNLKELAGDYVAEPGLAEALWKTETRELKILATLLYPPELFSAATADAWVKDIRHLEIAEQLSLNLLDKLSFAPEAAARWIRAKEEYVVVTGYLLYTRLFMKGWQPDETEASPFLTSSREVALAGVSRRQRAAQLALKRYGRLSEAKGEEVLALFADFQKSGDVERQEFYRDIQFEFEYYN